MRDKLAKEAAAAEEYDDEEWEDEVWFNKNYKDYEFNKIIWIN